MAPTLAYWKIRGLAQPIRLLMGYTKTDFEDKMYECGDGPEFSRESWLSEKESLGLAFPNLPYYIDGDIKVTQSNAILRYVGRKNHLDGETEEEKVRVDMMENQAMDFRNGFVRLCYNPDFENLKDAYKKNVVHVLKLFTDFIGDRKFFAGDKLTFPDFHMYELLDQHKQMDASILEPFPKLLAFMKRFEEVPEIAEFMKSDKFFKGDINNKQAVFKNLVQF